MLLRQPHELAKVRLFWTATLIVMTRMSMVTVLITLPTRMMMMMSLFLAELLEDGAESAARWQQIGCRGTLAELRRLLQVSIPGIVWAARAAPMKPEKTPRATPIAVPTAAAAMPVAARTRTATTTASISQLSVVVLQQRQMATSRLHAGASERRGEPNRSEASGSLHLVDAARGDEPARALLASSVRVQVQLLVPVSRLMPMVS